MFKFLVSLDFEDNDDGNKQVCRPGISVACFLLTTQHVCDKSVHLSNRLRVKWGTK